MEKRHSFNTITRTSAPGQLMLAKDDGIARAHVLTFAKSGYKTITMTVAAGARQARNLGQTYAGTATMWDWNGVVGTGQSLAVGDHGRRSNQTTQRITISNFYRKM